MKPALIASVVGTAAMTAYSYWQAYRQKKQFEEPQMLGKMMHRLKPEAVPANYTVEAGWIAHLGVGFFLAQLYALRWREKKPGLIEGLKVGVPSGLAAIGWWTSALKLHPNAPETDLKQYHRELFMAHLIFGVATAWAYAEKPDKPKGVSE